MHRIAIVATAALLAGCVGGKPPATADTVPYSASGNEPFWSLRLADGHAVLDRPEQAQRSFVLGEAQRTDEGRRYAGDGFTIDIVVGRCIDSMSGVARADQVRVEMGGERLSGCGGEKLPPETLNDTQWTVTELGGAPVALDPPPSLAIDAQGRVSGSDGCNRFMGGLVFGRAGAVTVSGQGAGTMMACPPDRDQVARSYNDLRATVNGWRFEGDRLVLTTNDGKMIRLKQSI